MLYSELSPAKTRAVQRRLATGELKRITPGVVTTAPAEAWPALIARERIRILAALYPKAVIGPRSAFMGGVPVDGVMYLTYTYTRRTQLPGLTVQLVTGHGPTTGDAPMMGRDLYFPSQPRVLLENLTLSRGKVKKSAGRAAVEQRVIEIGEARGEVALNAIRDEARELASTLGLARELAMLDDIVGAVLGTRKAPMATSAGKGLAAPVPYDAERLALFEKLAAELRMRPLEQPATVTHTHREREHFAFLEAYFSNFIEGTEFTVDEARAFVLEGKPVTERPKDSHDIIGVYRQAVSLAWANQTLAPGEPVLDQLRTRHGDMMQERPEAGPGAFKATVNRAGTTEFVAPRLVRGTLTEGSKLLPTVPAGAARALLVMFIVSEVHPFTDGNGRVARLVMNAELSVADSCRIIVPTLYREEYLDCLRVLSREGNPGPYISAMQKIHEWSAAFGYEDLDKVIAEMGACNAFETSLRRHKLLFPTKADARASLHH